jgi:hypothetical protein
VHTANLLELGVIRTDVFCVKRGKTCSKHIYRCFNNTQFYFCICRGHFENYHSGNENIEVLYTRIIALYFMYKIICSLS